ncbi:hypothetical protein BCON_0361g00110 [Botryotinia convoluta]|uniref:C2H2-type domain-containing protein n=1 Tax=Botryotinia convoluta TaxID=54673 RepID=A0A4Z1HC46_9HELO|nr:hypothetical protein BCON_0361g00110 [Botryotinia convoluta]
MELFVHFPAQGVIVCSECKYAVLPSHVGTHLKDKEKHRAVKADRERVVAAIQAIRGLKTKTAFPPARTDGLRCQLYNEYGNLTLFLWNYTVVLACDYLVGWIKINQSLPEGQLSYSNDRK